MKFILFVKLGYLGYDYFKPNVTYYIIASFDKKMKLWKNAINR